MNRDGWDVIVVGAGPAGASASVVLARYGARVLCLDHATFPRPKPCGDAIGPRTVTALAEIGAWDSMVNAGFNPFDTVRLLSPNGVEWCYRLPQKISAHSFIAPRYQFDSLLKDYASNCGAEFRHGHVRALIRECNHVSGVIAHYQDSEIELRAPFVILASGAGSSLPTEAQASRCIPRIRAVAIRAYVALDQVDSRAIQLHFHRALLPGYVWCFPVDKRTVNIGAGVMVHSGGDRARSIRRTLVKAIEDVIGMPAKHVQEPDWASWPLNLAYDRSSRVHGGAILVGDAGWFTNPATGDGIANAVISGIIAGRVICRALNDFNNRNDVLEEFNRDWVGHFGRQLRNASLIQKYILKHANVINLFFTLCAHHPSFARLIAEYM